ncbi:MAG: 4Fe-4S binding protein [Deltaproteobacteria bacterium]|nr:4Fe-4S binding protein [Deltaproteobacteria bacterium]
MKTMRKIIKIDEDKCDGCGLCVPACAEGAIHIVDGRARLVAERYCDGLGACLGECPRDALEIVDADVEEFDEDTAGQHLKEIKSPAEQEMPASAGGCPSARIGNFRKLSPCSEANLPHSQIAAGSELSNWPVQISLVPPEAPFLRNADILVAADCSPLAYANFHRDFLKGKVVLMGCPKFDDSRAYIEKFAQIFREAYIKSITVIVMEVPCCQGMPVILKKAMELAGKNIPMEQKTVSTKGKILH